MVWEIWHWGWGNVVLSWVYVTGVVWDNALWFEYMSLGWFWVDGFGSCKLVWVVIGLVVSRQFGVFLGPGKLLFFFWFDA